MSTLIHNQTTGARTFRVPFTGTLPGAPFEAGELEIETLGDEGMPRRVALRFLPTAFEFQARLPKLCEALGMPDAVFDFGRAAAKARPVVIYQAASAVVGRVPVGLKDLPGVEAYLAGSPALFDLKDYQLMAIEFEEGQAHL